MDKTAMASLNRMEIALNVLIGEWENHWSYGTNGDTVLVDIMSMSARFKRSAKEMLAEVQADKVRLENA